MAAKSVIALYALVGDAALDATTLEVRGIVRGRNRVRMQLTGPAPSIASLVCMRRHGVNRFVEHLRIMPIGNGAQSVIGMPWRSVMR